jgi:hypothetical protein
MTPSAPDSADAVAKLCERARGVAADLRDVLIAPYTELYLQLAALLEAERDRADHAKARLSIMEIGANRLADEVAVLVTRSVIDARSPAADALLDYRDPPRTPRSDRIAQLKRELAAAREDAERQKKERQG